MGPGERHPAQTQKGGGCAEEAGTQQRFGVVFAASQAACVRKAASRAARQLLVEGADSQAKVSAEDVGAVPRGVEPQPGGEEQQPAAGTARQRTAGPALDRIALRVAPRPGPLEDLVPGTACTANQASAGGEGARLIQEARAARSEPVGFSAGERRRCDALPVQRVRTRTEMDATTWAPPSPSTTRTTEERHGRSPGSFACASRARRCRFGFLAQCPTGQACTATFSRVALTETTLRDPRDGS